MLSVAHHHEEIVVKPANHGIYHFFEHLGSQRAERPRAPRCRAQQYQCHRFLAVPVHWIRSRILNEPEHDGLAASRRNRGLHQWPQGSIVEQRGSVNFTYLQAGFSGALSDQAMASGMRLLVPSPDFSDTNAVNAIKPFTNNILAFFMMDEPDCVAGGNTTTLNTLLTSIEAEIVKVKSNFPGAKTMFTAGCGFWTYSNFRIPTGMDYIAIESYGSTGDPATTKSEWLAKIN